MNLINTINDYQFFSRWQEAVDYYMEFEKVVSQASMSSMREVYERSNPKYKLLESYLEVLYPALKKLYPQVNMIPYKPSLIILEDDRANASIPTTIGNNKKGFLIIVTSGFLKLTKKEAISILAHELAHLYLQKDGKNGEVFPKGIAYEASEPEAFQFSSNLKHSEELEVLFREWMDLKYYTGPITLENFDGMVMEKSSTTESLYRLLSSQVMRNQTCATENTLNLQAKVEVDLMMMTDQMGLLNDSSYDFEQRAQAVTKVADELKRRFQNCLGNLKKGYYELMSESFGLSPETIRNFLEPRFTPERMKINQQVIQTFDEYSFFEAYEIIGEKFHQRMREIEKSISIRKARFFGVEDHADEVAVKILNELNIPIKHLNDFLTQNKKCDAYDSFYKDYTETSTSHPNGCWRAKRNQALWELLN